MGKIWIPGGGGGGTGSDECTASKAQVLSGYKAVTSDSGDEVAVGTMPNNGAQSGTLNCGQSKTIPAGYTSGGTVTANSLASQTGGATAEDKYVYNGKTYWKDGVKRTGNMTCSSVLSFSVAAYSTSQIVATWKNPAKGPFSGVIICAKTGGYPTGINDNRKYTGVGSNKAASGTSSVTISGLTPGTTYYFRIWAYTTCSAGNFYSGYLQATCAPAAHGRKAFTSSGTFTVPAGIRSINIFVVGGGAAGNFCNGTRTPGSGGAGGYTAYKNNIGVSPGTSIAVVVGAGGNGAKGGNRNGGASSASLNGTILVSVTSNNGRKGGSGGGESGYGDNNGDNDSPPGNGGSNGSDGYSSYGKLDSTYAKGQGTTTREFGLSSGTLYAGGGGGGAAQTTNYANGTGGAGGGGAGGSAAGTTGTGGGGGGAHYSGAAGGAGGSGAVVITW